MFLAKRFSNTSTKQQVGSLKKETQSKSAPRNPHQHTESQPPPPPPTHTSSPAHVINQSGFQEITIKLDNIEQQQQWPPNFVGRGKHQQDWSHASKTTTTTRWPHCAAWLVVIGSLFGMAQSGADHCYSDLGCFPLSPEFYHPRHRPFNVRPWHRRLIGTEFELFNAHHPAGFTLRPWNRLNLLESRFDARLETKIIVPGWLDNVDRAVWVKQLRDALLLLWAPTNLIVVRWRNFTPYTMATANTRVVGAELANLIKSIDHQLAYSAAYYHLIGHSLGAHIAAYCGDRVPGLGRITALDPARPFFQGMPKSVRLDRDDAKFVDAIHSDFTPENAILLLLMSFGMTTPVGHVDFYPNGPPLLQPGCLRDTLDSIRRGIIHGLQYSSLSVAFLDSMRYLTACDHQRAHEWFLESVINRQCVFVGVRCDTSEGLINGRCTCDDSPSACAIMGIHADQMYVTGLHEEVWPRSSLAAALAPLTGMGAGQRLHQQLSSGRAATREQIYGQLRLEAARLRLPAEPSPVATPDDLLGGQESAPLAALASAASQGDQQQVAVTQFAKLQPAANRKKHQLDYELESLLIGQAQAFEDAPFADYLRTAIQEPQQQPQPPPESSLPPALTKRQDEPWPPDQVGGHPRGLFSALDRNIENWYEHSSRWYLKTNNRPNYCANQYQVLVFLGPIKAALRRNHDGRLRANLVLSIVGSRGQLLNQRFVPRSTKLDSFTMQPFFILLEGSYSLGQIRSVALAWEARHEPEPIQATISFQNNKLAQLGAQVPALKLKHPWLAKTLDHDRSYAYVPPPPPPLSTSNSLLKRRQDIGGKLNGKRRARRQRHDDNDDELAPKSMLSQSSSTADAGGCKWAGGRELGSVGSGCRSAGGRVHLERRQQQVSVVNDNAGGGGDEGGDDYDDLDYAADESLDDPLLAHIGGGPAPAAPRAHPELAMQALNYYHGLAAIPDVGEQEQSFFEPLIEPLVSPSQLVNEQQAQQDDGRLTFKLNNLDLLLAHQQQHAVGGQSSDSSAHNNDDDDDDDDDESITIHRVVVSPLQANYGRVRVPNAKSFCSPRVGLRLRRDQTVKLRPSLVGHCH